MKKILQKILEASLIGCYDPESLYGYHKLPCKELVKRAKEILGVNMISRPRVVKVEKIREILTIENNKLNLEKMYAVTIENPAPVFAIDNPPPPRIILLILERDMSKIFLGKDGGRIESIRPSKNGGLDIKIRYHGKSFHFNTEFKKIVEDLRSLISQINFKKS